MDDTEKPKDKGGPAKSARVLEALTGRPRGASDRWGTVDFPLKAHQSPHGQVTAVSMMKDEGPFLMEWVAHHLAIGFTDLVVYTNDCSDGTDEMLIRMEELGLAHHRRNDIPEGIRPQPSALSYAQEEPVVCLSDWVMVFDADEFLSIRLGDGGLDGLISAAKAQGANGVVVTWRIFGSGGVVDWSRDPVTEQYRLAAPMNWNKGWGVKTLFAIDPDYWKLGIHRPKMKTRHQETDFPDHVKWLTGSGAVMEDYFKFRGWRSITRTVGYDWVQMNHYAVKSVDSYAIRKTRGNVNNKKDKYNSDYWALQDRNEDRDDTMLRYSETRNRIIVQLLQDPFLKQLHDASVLRAETRLAELRATDAYRDLVLDLAKASTVPIGQIVAKPPQPRDKEKIAALMSDVEKRRNVKAKEDRQGEDKAPVKQIPMGSYVPGTPDVAEEPNVEWVENQGLFLPLDSRVFAATALALIGVGKFERSLARKLPQPIPSGSSVMEIGSAAGFLGLHLTREKPDLQMVMHEDNATLRATMMRVMARNKRSFGNGFSLSELPLDNMVDDTAALVQTVKPRALLLADPRLSPQVLAEVIPKLTVLPERIFLYGRLLESWPDFAELTEILAEMDYERMLRFDESVALEFHLGKDKD